MPKMYEAMRDQFIKEGMSEKDAKAKAARIYNAKHKKDPVHPGMKETNAYGRHANQMK